MTQEEQQQQFEQWVSSPPFERSIEKQPESSAWYGLYQDLTVELAWLAWRECYFQQVLLDTAAAKR